MKAKRILPGQDVNPHYSETDKRRARRAGQPYDTPPFLTFPVGEIVDDPNCWMHCVGGKPNMVPADEECKNAVLRHLNDADRKALLTNVIRLNQPSVRKQQTKDQLAFVDMMLEIYDDEIAELQGESLQAVTKPSPVRNVPPAASQA